MEEKEEHAKIAQLVRVPKGEVTLADEILRVLREKEKQQKEKAVADNEQLTFSF